MNISKFGIIKIAAISFLTSQLCFAKNITNYQELVQELKSGHKAYALIDAKKCQPGPGSSPHAIESILQLGIRMNDLYEVIGVDRTGQNKKMVATGGESGLFGNQTFYLTRSLFRVIEDNSVDVIEDLVDPTTYKLYERTWLVCQLSDNGSGGVVITAK